ncbi:glycosyltransferase family 4 protein [Streptomyces sp. NPDC001941]|uniref:glycosyltransferase family 4 protein n=1 Tax=Streptomyces sp. NPDC001941 TaxID=3154659 RepID=UPI00332C1F57
MKISFLIHTVYGIGGTIRTTLNLAEELVDRHEVEIVSVFRHRDVPLFDIDPRISVVPLVDTRPKSPTNEKQSPEQLRPAAFFPRTEARYKEYSALTDARVRAHYEGAGADADVVIGTRPGLSAYTAQFAPPGAVRIGQEHMTYNHHKQALKDEIRPHLAALDAYVTVSEGDAAVWRERMDLPGTRVLCVPNSVPEPTVAPADLSGTTVVAAGRLSREKQYEVLVDAFAKVVAVRPEWTLRICGWGPEKDKLRRRVERRGLSNSVYLMGPRSPIEPEWVKGAIAVSTSRHESFGMTLVEAMRCGLPVVSTDCDYGPREIVADGEDGLLVPVGDAEAVAQALLRLIDDQALRRRMGAAAIVNARRYDPGSVAKQYADLFAELGAGSGQRSAARTAGQAADAEDTAFAPAADAVVAEDGTVTVRLVAPEAAVARHEGLRLVCTRIGQDAPERAYPFGPDGTAVIPAGEEFAEGHWMCHADHPATGTRVGILARAVDQRASMRAAAHTAPEEPVRHLVPYRRAPKHHLVLCSYARPVHAEAGEITHEGRDLVLSGRLYGPAELDPGFRPVLTLRRGGNHPDELTVTGTRQGARAFRFSVPGTLATARQASAKEIRTAWLTYAPGAAPVRIGRVLDDVVQKADVFTYPGVLLHKKRPLLLLRRVLRKLRKRQQRLVRIRFGYDAGNGLVLHVADR